MRRGRSEEIVAFTVDLFVSLNRVAAHNRVPWSNQTRSPLPDVVTTNLKPAGRRDCS